MMKWIHRLIFYVGCLILWVCSMATASYFWEGATVIAAACVGMPDIHVHLLILAMKNLIIFGTLFINGLLIHLGIYGWRSSESESANG